MKLAQLTMASVALTCLLAAPAGAVFQIEGSASGTVIDPMTIVPAETDVANPLSFVVTGSGPGDDHDVSIHLEGSFSDANLTLDADLYFYADVFTGEIGAYLGGHTESPGSARPGPAGMSMTAWMWNIVHVDAGPGDTVGDPVQIDYYADWDGHILMEGIPWSGSYVEYQARLFMGDGGKHGVKLAELDYIDVIGPPRDDWVHETLRQRIDVHVGDTLSMYQYIRCELNGSSYSGATVPSGDNYLDFLDTGWSAVGYAPGYEGLNLWTESGAVILPVPLPSATAMFGAAMLAHFTCGARRSMRRRAT